MDRGARRAAPRHPIGPPGTSKTPKVKFAFGARPSIVNKRLILRADSDLDHVDMDQDIKNNRGVFVRTLAYVWFGFE